MKGSPPIASRAVFAWTAVLTILLAIFAFVTLLTNSKSVIIKKNIQVLQLEKDNYHKIDTCIALLYSAENNSRFFMVTKDSAYINAYENQLQSIIGILNKYETDRESNSKLLSGLISNKQKKNEEFVNLRMMVDSLLSLSLTTPEVTAFKSGKSRRKAEVTKSEIKTDTVEIVAKKSKKNLMKRIMDAIKDKELADKRISQVNSNTIVKTDSVELPPPSLPVKNHALLENARRELSITEQQLLAINSRIFARLQHSLQELKYSEEQEIKAFRESILTATKSRFDEMSMLIWGSVLLVAILAAMIIWNLVKLYKKDVTIIRYASQMAETTKRKGDFMAQMTHEIRTPLNSIIGFSNLIDSRKIDENLRVNVSSIKSASQILLSLVNEILDFSKFESGKITLQNQPFRPVMLFEEVISMLSVLAAEKNIRIVSRLEPDRVMTLNGDNFRIKQIAINLLTNAIKFTPANGQIMVSLNFDKGPTDQGMLKIGFKDSGVGIAQEHLGAIFEDFIQIESRDDNAVQTGTGLGLAICKRIVDLYGGKITVESILGEGSEFKVSLPLKIIPNVATVAASEESKPVSTTLLEGKKVLVADDFKMNLLLTSRILDKLGASYDLVENGQEAFDKFSTNTYDLIITDIEMPVMNGLELTKRIRGHADEKKAQIPVLGFTGSTADDNLAYYTEIGMNGVLEKPFDEQHFTDLLRRLWLPES